MPLPFPVRWASARRCLMRTLIGAGRLAVPYQRALSLVFSNIERGVSLVSKRVWIAAMSTDKFIGEPAYRSYKTR